MSQPTSEEIRGAVDTLVRMAGHGFTGRIELHCKDGKLVHLQLPPPRFTLDQLAVLAGGRAPRNGADSGTK